MQCLANMHIFLFLMHYHIILCFRKYFAFKFDESGNLEKDAAS
jgi:hypothetical protein